MSNTPKKSLASKKTAPAVVGPPNFMQDKLTLSKEIADYITAQDKDWRWINYPKYVEAGGIHDNGWTAFKLPDELKGAPGTLQFGTNPDGIIRRGECLLATRPKEYSEQHRAWLKQKTALQSGAKRAKAAAENLRAMARESGVAAEVEEGFDE
jgi:hypothetical protein